MTENNEEKEKEKTVTIKGIKEDLFKKVKDLAYYSGKTMGDLTNKAYELLLNSVQGINEVSKSFQLGLQQAGAITIGPIEELSIDAKEIAEEGKKVIFRDIKKLTITSVTNEILDKYIEGIYDVDELTVTGSFSKIKVLSKCSNVKKVNF